MLLKITIENILGKEENVGYQHFLLFPSAFSLTVTYTKKLDCLIQGL